MPCSPSRFNEEATLKLYKQIGRWKVVVGMVELKRPMAGESWKEWF
ncbi:hypothetical protein [Brevibacillus choshinensis]|nr:hypothetical protein [Brevibacillus choshinensis]MED4752862.1 hypothetical protein [Brevibacillus choshinensis]